eukprot:966305-Pyramimonas_sp.AAC.1
MSFDTADTLNNSPRASTLKPGARIALVMSPFAGMRLFSGVTWAPFNAFTISPPARAIILGVVGPSSSPVRVNAEECTIRLRCN